MDNYDDEHARCLAEAQAEGLDCAAEYLRLMNTEVDRITAETLGARHRLRPGEPIRQRAPTLLLQQARQRAKLLAQFRTTPEAQWLAAIAMAEAKLQQVALLLERARCERSRNGFVVAAETCHNLCDDAQSFAMDAALQLVAAAGLAEEVRIKAYEARG